jgi:hypothetical protein
MNDIAIEIKQEVMQLLGFQEHEDNLTVHIYDLNMQRMEILENLENLENLLLLYFYLMKLILLQVQKLRL